jgi:cysteinyl-tRNA synthetase
MSELELFNTLTRTKSRFESLEPGRVRIYSCGPTVYSRQHLGNMRPYLVADLLSRTLAYAGYEVRQVINITDVGHLTSDADFGDDKVEKAAREQGLDAWEIAEKWARVFKEDLEKLRVARPAVWCKATDHIPEQVEMIETLEKKGFTYRTSDGIYFDTSKDPNYGELARIDLEAQRSSERIGGSDEKRNPVDFALWKFSPSEGPRRQMEWDSPWGRGFPGWHIECSAMSSKYLGVPFDIHTGGVDHIAVHHPNEIAQSENVFDVRPWVRWWMHEEWLMFEGEKIAKSTGGVVSLSDLEAAGIDPLAFRMFFLSAHYRQQQTYSDEAIRGSSNAYQRLVRHAIELRQATDSRGADATDGFRARFRDALYDDLNAPQALAVLWEAVRSPELGSVEKWALVRDFDRVLGLGLEEARLDVPDLDARVEELIREREAARAAKDFARADEIRAELRAQGIILEDGPEGTSWRRA